jgi:glycogen synthase
VKTVRKIKIAIGCDSYFPVVNGVIEVVKNQFDYFNQHFETRLLIPKYKNCQYDHLNHMYQIRSIKGRGKCRGAFPNIDHGFKKYLEAFRPDVIHIHSPFNVGKHCLKYAKKHNIPFVFTFHTKFKDDFKRLLPFK